MTVLIVMGILLCICASAFFSSSEMAYSSCNQVRLENLEEDGSRRAGLARKLAEDYEDTLSAILIGNNLANIAGSSLASVLVILLAGSDQYAWLATVIMTVLVIIFGETIPKITAKKKATTLAMRNAYPIQALRILLFPLIWLVVTLVRLLTPHRRDEDIAAESEEAVDELQMIIETAEDEDVIDEDRSELVQAAIDFSEIPASAAMTARVDLQALNIDDDWDDILATVENANHSRIPVYENRIDNIIGVLYLNHFFKAIPETLEPIDIRSLLMPACFVYQTMKLPQVLDRLKRAKQHLAVVTDEYGGTLGVITMEDVLEEIVGDIWDETDEVIPEYTRNGEGEYELDGDMPIADFLDLMEIDEADFQAESKTVGGWTVETLERFPQEGESFQAFGLTIRIMKTDGRRVEKLLVKKNEAEEAAEE